MKYVILIHSNPDPVGAPDRLVTPTRAGRCPQEEHAGWTVSSRR